VVAAVAVLQLELLELAVRVVQEGLVRNGIAHTVLVVVAQVVVARMMEPAARQVVRAEQEAIMVVVGAVLAGQLLMRDQADLVDKV
jgi:hypothetical protein